MIGKPSIFRDAGLQSRFDEDGYVVMDFITPEDARSMGEKFYEVHNEIPPGFYADAYSSDDALKSEIYAHMQTVFLRTLEECFQNYKVLGGTYLSKAPGDAGKVGVHQDWTVVDESRYYSLTIWVPVQDVDETNGALRVLPGSHLFFDYYRSDNIPYAYRGNEQMLWDNMITVPMKAGQAFILNHAVLHASAPNFTDKERLVIAYGLVPKDADLMFYYRERNNDLAPIEKFNMPDDFFQRYYNVGHRPKFGELASTFDYLVPAIVPKKLKKMIDGQRLRKGLPIIPKVANSYGLLGRLRDFFYVNG